MRIALIASALVLSGCGMFGAGGWFGGDKPAQPREATTVSGAKLAITTATWAAYENYRYWLTPKAWTRPMGEGYFAVAEDGRSWGLTGCPVNDCVPGMPIHRDAIAICQSRSNNVPCVIFAHNQEIVRPYEIVD